MPASAAGSGSAGAGQTDQDGQPDLHRRRAAGPRRGGRLRPAGGARRRRGGRHDQQGRGRQLADGEPGAARWRPASSSSGSPSSGCARISRSASPRPTGSAPGCPLTALVDQFYKQVIERGGLRWDTSSLVHLLAAARSASAREQQPVDAADRRRSRQCGSPASSIESKRRIRRPIATLASSLASEAPRQ